MLEGFDNPMSEGSDIPAFSSSRPYCKTLLGMSEGFDVALLRISTIFSPVAEWCISAVTTTGVNLPGELGRQPLFPTLAGALADSVLETFDFTEASAGVISSEKS